MQKMSNNKVIIIHHVQQIWNDGLLKYGTSFDEQIQNIYDHLIQNKYDRVIVTNFEADFFLDKDQYILHEFNPEVYDYMYGWELDELDEKHHEKIESGEIVKDEYGTEWTKGGTHSEIVIVSEWMHSIKNDDVFLCGAFDGECIEDMEIALLSVCKNFTKKNRIEYLIT